MAPKAVAPPRKGVVAPAGGGQDSNRDKKGKKGAKSGSKERKMHFTVPEGVAPGDMLRLMTPRGGEVEVEVPSDAKVGKSFAVTVPEASSVGDKPKREAARVSVTVPKGALPGQVIKGKTPGGKEFDVAVPAGIKPGKSFLVMVPLEDDESEQSPEQSPGSPAQEEVQEVQELNAMFSQGPPSQRRTSTDLPPSQIDLPEPIAEESADEAAAAAASAAAAAAAAARPPTPLPPSPSPQRWAPWPRAGAQCAR
jgi:hypothetical protein